VPAQSKRHPGLARNGDDEEGGGWGGAGGEEEEGSSEQRLASRRGAARRIMRPNETNEVKHSKPTARATSAIRFLIIVINSTGTEAGGCAALLEGERIAARRAVIFPP